jgi:glyoxylase-like metal-dependent hydrolase (beta-lactamase superfamily II)
VLAPNPSLMTGPGTNTYLIGEDAVAVVDPGPDLAQHVEAIIAAVRDAGGQIVASLVTHAHPDHLPAAYRLREQIGAPIFGHPDIPSVDHPLRDGSAVTVESLHLVAYETPGHADEHLCFWLRSEKLLFCGDLIAGVGTVVLSETPGSLIRYMASLQRVEALGPSTILPGHGPIVADGLAKIREYLAHRAQRDQQIVDVLRSGPATVDTLVERIYVDTPPGLYAMAVRNVRAHLDRLSALGRVAVSDETWELRQTPEIPS